MEWQEEWVVGGEVEDDVDDVDDEVDMEKEWGVTHDK